VRLGRVPPGLTEAEAAARWREGQDNAVHLKPPRTRQQIWRENVYTIFNLSLVGLAFTQLLLQQWWSALLSLVTIALNVGIKVGQEMLAMRRLAEFQASARPRATVVREGQTRSIDPDRIVPGDVLIVGPGDQFLVDGQVAGDGQMVVDESAVTGKRSWHPVAAGDAIYAGSVCISGRGAYLAEKVGDERLFVSRVAGIQASARGVPGGAELTPLERLVDRILRAMLVLVGVFALLLLVEFFRLDVGVPVDMFSDAASVIFNIAPSGLFLMIIVTYTTGTADLTGLGALVHRARSVESLAEATVICFAEAGILSGTMMEIEPVHDPQDPDQLPESRLRQILGDYGRSTSAPNQATRFLTHTFEGNRRRVREEAPFLTALGWSAVTFDEPDLPGVYVLAEPGMVEGHLVTGVAGAAPEKENTRAPAAVRQFLSPLGRLLRRGAQDSEAQAEQGDNVVPEDTGDADGADDAEGEGKKNLLFRRWARQIGQTLRRAGPEPEEAETTEAASEPDAVLLFAQRPDPVPLRDANGNVQLPGDLIPLCELRYAQRLRPEAARIVRVFAQTGVSVKAFSSDEPDQVVTLFQQAGLGQVDGDSWGRVGAISGHDLEALPRAEWARAASEHAVFGHITPEQAGALVRALRECGESVAVVGDGVTDLPALQQANLAIARQTSAQAALGVADVVMMGSSPEALLQVLEKGQRIVHGLLDVLKLNLVQIFCLALLIAAIQVFSVGFPYASAQGAAIAVITVTLPSVALPFWASSGRVSSERFGQLLTRFVAPAAVSMALAALLVYVYLLKGTGRLAYAQLAVTYTLLYAGLLLAVFVKPPWHASREEKNGARKWDWRMTGLVLFLGIITFFLPAIPAAQKHLKLDWLSQPADYGVIGLVVVAWAVLLNLVWWVMSWMGGYQDDRAVAEPA
jgi:magnesium-transporting ATPase (P-type)